MTRRSQIETEYQFNVDGKCELLRVTIDYNLDLPIEQLSKMLRAIGIDDDHSPDWRRWLLNQLMANERN